MDLRSTLDNLKQFLVIGKDNRFLHGDKRTQEEMAYDPAYAPGVDPAYAQQYAQYGYAPPSGYGQGYAAPPQPQAGVYPQGAYAGADYNAAYAPQAQPYAPQQAAYAPQASYQQLAYGQTAYQQPQAPYQPAQGAYQQQQAYAQGYPPQQAAYAQQAPAPTSPYARPQDPPSYQTQIAPDGGREQARNRRSQQHAQESYQPAPAVPENVVPFPGMSTQTAESRAVDAYVINVFNIMTCRQAMSCLRKGHCTLIVIDQLIEKSEIRRYVDMLTGACYALNGTMTRLSARIGFYIMAPNGMTVYTDPTTSSANAQSRVPQQPLYRAGGNYQAAGQAAAHQGTEASYQTPPLDFYTQQPAQPQEGAAFAQQQQNQGGYAPDDQPQQARYAAL